MLSMFAFGCPACLATPAEFGAGLFVALANLTMTDSTFVGNNAGQYGGGIVQYGAGSMNIQNTSFEYNNADIAGGAIAIATASDADRWVKTAVCVLHYRGNVGSCTSTIALFGDVKSPNDSGPVKRRVVFAPFVKEHEAAMQLASRIFPGQKPLSIAQRTMYGWN